jgi:hypothetical protein
MMELKIMTTPQLPLESQVNTTVQHTGPKPSKTASTQFKTLALAKTNLFGKHTPLLLPMQAEAT